jgi:8-oxo-dGTP pyrophosphatase MutT (NUDIX family)
MTFHDFIKDGAGWAVERKDPLFVHQYLEVDQVRLSSPSRPEPFEWTVCHRKAGVVVAAQSPGGGFVLVRQERVPVRATLWEFPAGQIDQGGVHEWQTIVDTGLRELGEEAGFELGAGGEVVSMHHFLSSPGFTDEHCYQLWVKGAVPAARGMQLDPNEAILEVRLFSWLELQAMVLAGEIRDANTLCCLARLGAILAAPQKGAVEEL